MVNIRHFLTNLVGAVLPILVILISVPLYLNTIGAEKYGVLALVWIVFGYFGIFDFGVSRAVNNAISRMRGETVDKRALVIWSACALNMVVGTIIALIAGLGFFLYARASDAPMFQEVVKSLPLMMLGVPVLTLTSALNGALEGEERFKTSNGIQLVGSTLYQLAPLGVAMYLSKDVHVLIDTIIVCRVILLLLYFAANAFAFKILDHIAVSMASIRDLVRFGAGIAVINILDPLLSRIDQIAIAQFTGVSHVAAFNIATNSIGRLNIVPLALSKTLFPKLSQGKAGDFTDDLHKIKARLMLVWFGVCAVVIVACPYVFQWWLHNAIAPQVSEIAQVLVIALWANCLAYLPYTALQAQGRSGLIIKAHLIELPFYLAAMWGLTVHFGAIGAAAANGLRTFVDYIILWKMCAFPVRRQGIFAALFGGLIVICLLINSAAIA